MQFVLNRFTDFFLCDMFLGRLDRKIEFPIPDETARARILQIHSRKMNVNKDVNFEELARCTDDFNGAQLKAVCVESVRTVKQTDRQTDRQTRQTSNRQMFQLLW